MRNRNVNAQCALEMCNKNISTLDVQWMDTSTTVLHAIGRFFPVCLLIIHMKCCLKCESMCSTKDNVEANFCDNFCEMSNFLLPLLISIFHPKYNWMKLCHDIPAGTMHKITEMSLSYSANLNLLHLNMNPINIFRGNCAINAFWNCEWHFIELFD